MNDERNRGNKEQASEDGINDVVRKVFLCIVVVVVPTTGEAKPIDDVRSYRGERSTTTTT